MGRFDRLLVWLKKPATKTDVWVSFGLILPAGAALLFILFWIVA